MRAKSGENAKSIDVNLVFPQFLKIWSSDFNQIWGISRGPQGASVDEIRGKFISESVARRAPEVKEADPQLFSRHGWSKLCEICEK